MNSNYAVEILEDEIKRECCLFSICVDLTLASLLHKFRCAFCIVYRGIRCRICVQAYRRYLDTILLYMCTHPNQIRILCPELLSQLDYGICAVAYNGPSRGHGQDDSNLPLKTSRLERGWSRSVEYGEWSREVNLSWGIA